MATGRSDGVDGLMDFLREEDPARATAAKALAYRLSAKARSDG